jgi:hypothetical protein
VRKVYRARIGEAQACDVGSPALAVGVRSKSRYWRRSQHEPRWGHKWGLTKVTGRRRFQTRAQRHELRREWDQDGRGFLRGAGQRKREQGQRQDQTTKLRAG